MTKTTWTLGHLSIGKIEMNEKQGEGGMLRPLSVEEGPSLFIQIQFSHTDSFLTLPRTTKVIKREISPNRV